LIAHCRHSLFIRSAVAARPLSVPIRPVLDPKRSGDARVRQAAGQSGLKRRPESG
jgi:hypothetical protein